ncbi:MAG: transposase [Geminicoccaceae bacterium]
MTGKPVAVILGPGKTPDGTEVALVLRHVVQAIRVRWPAVDIVIRGDNRRRPRRWTGSNITGSAASSKLAGNPDPHGSHRRPLAEDVAVQRYEKGDGKVRRFRIRYAARTWKVERRVIARVEGDRAGRRRPLHRDPAPAGSTTPLLRS